MPTNPTATPAHLRVEFTVTPKGEAIDFHVLESSDDQWPTAVLREMRGCRFRGAEAEVNGTFDITVGQYKPSGPPPAP